MNEGPGRGAQQYEMNVFTGGLDENPQRGAETAVRRLKNAYEAYGLEMSDDWETQLNISELNEPSYNIDFSTLPENYKMNCFMQINYKTKTLNC